MADPKQVLLSWGSFSLEFKISKGKSKNRAGKAAGWFNVYNNTATLLTSSYLIFKLTSPNEEMEWSERTKQFAVSHFDIYDLRDVFYNALAFYDDMDAVIEEIKHPELPTKKRFKVKRNNKDYAMTNRSNQQIVIVPAFRGSGEDPYEVGFRIIVETDDHTDFMPLREFRVFTNMIYEFNLAQMANTLLSIHMANQLINKEYFKSNLVIEEEE
jgi:hypothetical protein